MIAPLVAGCVLGLASPVICVDPGHPSENGVGAKGKEISELKLVWNVAVKLKARLTKAGYRVVMTKSRVDESVTNRRRAEIANQAEAALMLRLHADAGSHRGFATYYPDRTGKAHGKTGPSREVITQSSSVAKLFHPAAIKSLEGFLPNHGLYPDTKTKIGGQQGALTGSIFSEVPVLLVELCVVTNPKDEVLVKTDAGQNRLADALLAGVRAAVPIKPRNG